MRAKDPFPALPDADKDVDTGGREYYDRGADMPPFHSPSWNAPFGVTNQHNNHHHHNNNNNNGLSQTCRDGARKPHSSPQNHPYLSYVGDAPLSDSPPPLPHLMFDLRPQSSTAEDPGPGDAALVGSMLSYVEGDRNGEFLKGGGRARTNYSNSKSANERRLPDNRELVDFNSNSEFGFEESSSLVPPHHRPHQSPREAPLPTSSSSLLAPHHLNHHSLPSQHHPKNHHHHYQHHHHQQHNGGFRRASSHNLAATSTATSHTSRNCRRSSSSRQNKSSSTAVSSAGPVPTNAAVSVTHSRSFGGRASLPSLLGSLAELRINGEEDIKDLIIALRSERSRLLKEIVQEDEERSTFYAHLESLNQRLRSLPHQYNVGCERYRVEGEMCRIQEALSERLGPPAVMLRRRDQRLHAINAIEKTIQRLRQEKTVVPPPHSAVTSRDRIPAPTASSATSSRGVPPRIPNPSSGTRQGAQHHDGSRFLVDSSAMDFVNANQVRGESHSDPQLGSLQPPSGQPPDLPPPPSDSPEAEMEREENGAEDGSKFHPTIEAVLRGAWPFEKALWHSSPASVGVSYKNGTPETTPGIMSTSSVTNRRAQSQQQLLTNKVEMVYGLLSMFSSGDRDDMSRTLLAMSSSPDSCVAMRQSGCLPLLIQLLHGNDDTPPTREARLRAGQALHNIVHSHTDDKRGRREARVLRLLEQLRDYSDSLWEKLQKLCAGRGPLLEDAMEKHPGPAMAALMKLSFDEEHRAAMCVLGGLHAIAELIRRDHEAHGSQTADQHCTTLRRYAGMALTNLTFGDGSNKALLCSFRSFMRSLVSQLHSPSEDLRQVTASVLRNLSWRADGNSKASLRDVGAVAALTQAALTAKKESTLKVILSAVWNLSAHCSMNKADICAVEGALAFICSTLTYKSQSKTLSIIENGGGILRNISSHIAIRDDLRQVLRDHNTLSVLLSQLRSPSLTVVSNACGTLWNLSARCPHDQAALWNLGAVPMLRSLINSKHKMISMGSSAALKNLLQAKPEGAAVIDGRHGMGLPSLQARKQKALEQELDPSLAETCDNIEVSPRSSPTTTQPEPPVPMFHSLGHYHNGVLSDSRDSVVSTHSDKTHDRMQQMLLRHHSGRECQAGGEFPLNGVLEDPTGDGSHLGGFGNKFKNLADSDVASKVTNLGNKYCNGAVTSKGGKGGAVPSADKPLPQIDNYMNKDTQERGMNKDLDDEDQPTDFSLRYSEEGEDVGSQPVEASHHLRQNRASRKPPSESVAPATPSRNGFFESSSSVHDDSVRTFCTEGTPYNFSTATSLSDLRDIGPHSASKGSEARDSEEDLAMDIEDLNDIDLEMSSKEEKPRAAQGVASTRLGGTSASTDNPVTYCVEGTPVSLSRISSVSSISSGEMEERIDKELLDDDIDDDEDVTERIDLLPEGPRPRLQATSPPQQTKESSHPQETFQHPSDTQQQVQTEGGAQVQVCDQTPLMFSRATSVSSLSSFEIQSIHDDRSSIVSDFSRMASGIISPSDLPDSPTQTVPTSPKGGRPTNAPGLPAARNLQLTEPRQSTGVFRDAPRAFNEEGTPAEFSHGTSLSSLTFDEEDFPPRSRGDGKDSTTTTATTTSERSLQESPLPPRPSRDPVRSSIPRPHTRSQEPGERKGPRDASRDGRPVSRTSSEGPPPVRNEPKMSSEPSRAEDTDDEMRLAALIKSGMPPSKKPNCKAPTATPVAAPRAAPAPNRTALTPALPPPPPPLASTGAPLSSAIPIQTPNLQVTVQAINFNAAASAQKQDMSGSWSSTGADSVRAFFTEDTPASVSKAGSTSDLSQLSRLTPSSSTSGGYSRGGPQGSESADSEESPEGKRLLEKCIRSGMPKPKSNIRGKDAAGHSTTKDRPPLLSPRRSPHHRPVPVARVTPAVKVGVVNPQVNALKSPSSFPSEEIRTYAVEGTPVEFSPSASLSDLSVDTPPHHTAAKRGKPPTPTSRGLNSPKAANPLGTFSPSEEVPKAFGLEGTPSSGLSRHSSMSSGVEGAGRERRGEEEEEAKCYGVEGTPLLYSRNSSLSSLSIESEETTPREEALLRKCINQGMPKAPLSRIPQVAGIVPRGVPPPRITPGVPMPHLLLNRASQHSSTSSLSSEAESRKLHTENEESEKRSPRKAAPQSSSFPGREEETELMSEESSATTASTVVAAKGARVPSPEEEKRSSPDRGALERSTPSSGSVEMRSDASMSESQAVLAEALRVAKAVSRDGNGGGSTPHPGSSDEVSLMSASVASASSACIELVKPPSAMGSLLSLSTSSVDEGSGRLRHPPSTPKKLECRHTKKMPEMVRRALGEQELGSECPSLASSCHSNIDNFMPPSLMEDDMESSMISVASITSEVVEHHKIDSPPSMGDIPSEIAGPARHIANLLQKEAQPGGATSSLTFTLTAGDEASTCQEITDLDETLGAQPDGGATSDTEIMVDDIPQDIPDLPLDSPLRQRAARGGSPRIGVGPRRSQQLRENARNSSREGSSPDSSKGGSPDWPRSPAQQRTARQRRSDDADRFRTRTISFGTPSDCQQGGDVDMKAVDEPGDDSPGRIVPVQNGTICSIDPNSGRRSFRQRRNEDPERYHTRTIDTPMMDLTRPEAGKKEGQEEDRIVEFHDGEDLCLTAAQMEVLSQDANIVICSLNETREAMTISEGPEENILDIETLSLISNEDEEEMLHLLEDPPSDVDEEALAMKGPRIVKPGEEHQRVCAEEPPGKGIRGKRRALYPGGRHQAHVPCTTKAQREQQAAPQRHTQPASQATRTAPPTKHTQSSTSPKQPRATRASTLRQTTNSRGGSSSEDSPRQSSSPASSAGSSPKLGGGNRGPVPGGGVSKAKSKETLHPFRRQNTFTKEDGEAGSSAEKTKKTPQTKATKGRVRKDSVQPSQTHPAASNPMGGDWGMRARSAPQKSASLTRDAQPPTAKDVAEWGTGTDPALAKGATIKTAKKDVTSRIANLWKKVEKAQGASKAPTKGKDGRVWISNASEGRGQREAPPPNRPLVRSSTFEKEGQVTAGGRSGLGLKLSRLKGRDTRSSPPSEASTPVDSRPQCLVSPTRITPRPRPSTHPSVTPRAAHKDSSSPEESREKRLSRLGSFIVVDEEEPQRGRAVVAPFSYRENGEPPQRASSITRIPQPAKPLQNKPRDDNGNAAIAN